MVTVTVSRRTGTVGVGGSFNPGADVDEVFFAVGTISLVDLGRTVSLNPPPYPPEHGALFNLFPHRSGFTAYFPEKRETGVSVNGAWLGILRRPSHGWGGQVFSPYDFDIFGGEARRNERVWAIARFLQAADPDFPRAGTTGNLPPQDQEIQLHNEAIAWASEPGREVGFSAGDNGKLTVADAVVDVDAGDIFVLSVSDDAATVSLKTEAPAGEEITIIPPSPFSVTLRFESLTTAADNLQAGILAFSSPPAAFADAPTARDDSVLDFLPALSVFIHPSAERTPLGLPYYFNRYSFSQGVNGKESRVPTVEGVSFDERTGEFVIDDYPGNRAGGLAATMFIGYLHGEETRYRVMELQGARDFGATATDTETTTTLTINGAILITFAQPNYAVSITGGIGGDFIRRIFPPLNPANSIDFEQINTRSASSFDWIIQALSFNTLYIEPVPRNDCNGDFSGDDLFVVPDVGGKILVRYADAGDNCRRNADLPPPATSLRATTGTVSGDFRIDWDAVGGAAYYKLYRSAGGDSFDPIGGDIAGLEFIDRGLAVGIRYAYQVEACNNAGCSPRSPAVEVESLATPILSAQAISENGDDVAVALRWREEGATSFEIERALTLTGAYESIGDGNFAFSYRFVDSNVEKGTTYYYRLRLCNDFGCSGYSEVVSVLAVPPPPGVVATFDEESDLNEINLSWQEVPGASYYRVLRSLPNGQFEVVADNLQDPKYTDTVPLTDQDYEYRVEYCDAEGNCAPVADDLVVVRRPQPAPPEVASSRVYIDGSAAVNLTWDEIERATLYRLLRAESENGEYVTVTMAANISMAAETFTATARPDGIVYYYRVEACSSFGCGRSAATKLSLSLPAPVVDSLPFDVYLDIDSNGRDATSTLRWDKVNDATRYNVLRADDADGPYATLVTILRGEELVFIDDDLGVNYTYYYVLQACHAFACGRSDADELLVAPLPPPVVEFPLRIIGASLGADEESVAVTLEWDAVEYTRQYNILRSINGEDGDYVRVGKVRDDLMFVDGVTINFVYHYRLQACNPFGCDVSDKAVEFTMPGKVRIDTVFNQPLTLSAGASRGESVLTVLVRGGTNPRFSSGTNNNFDNTGRRTKTTVSLTRAAAAAFNSDGVTLGFILKAISDDGDASTMTVRFVSTPRAVSANPRTNVLLAADAALGGVVLAGGASGLSIWHNKRDGAAGVETYSLRGGRGSSDDRFFSVNADSGQIAVNVPSLQLGLYDLELLLADEAIGLTATLELRINVIESPADEAVRIFLEEIASGARQWRGEDEADDWDGDNIANPYDWTPDSVAVIGLDGLIEVNLDMNNADGSSGNPWPIYNVWQLQAIGGMSVSRSGQKSSSNFLFGGSARFRDYRLAADVDATPTREWKDGGSANIVGFDPISGVFGGSLDGEGREIRGLYMKLDGDNGLFHEIGSAGRVLRLGLPDVEISGSGAVRVAPVAHESSGLVSLVWATGEVVANGGFASGLVRQLNSGGQVRESWFVGKVRGSTSTGGLVGYATAGDVRDSWAVARVEWSGTGSRVIGGLVGASEGGFSLFNSWSGGRFDANVHALIGGAGSFSRSYFDSAISPQSGVNTASALVVDTMVTVTDSTWSTDAWSFGKTTDYPFLRRIDKLWPGLQAVVFADFQTENLVVTTLEVEGRSSLEIGESITLSLGDTNGLAPDGGLTPTRTCANESKYAKLNHNDVTVQLQASGDGSAVFTADCEIVISFADPKTLSLGYFSVSALIASKEATISRWSHSFALNTLFAPLPDTGVVVPADAAKGYAFLTVTLLAGKLERDAADRTPIFGYTGSPYFDSCGCRANTITTSERPWNIHFDLDHRSRRTSPRDGRCDRRQFGGGVLVVGWRRDGIVCERR